MVKVVTHMSREELENTVIEQSRQLKLLHGAYQNTKQKLQQAEENYDVLSNVVLKARQVLSC